MANGGSSYVDRWAWLIVWVALLLITIFIVFAGQVGGLHPWSGVTPDRIASYHHEQCETVTVNAFLLQAQNFWSNVFYIGAGLLILMRNDSLVGRFVGCILIFLGFGSEWFHGTLSEFGQTVDMMGVYAVLLAMIAYGFIEMVPLSYNGVAAWVIMLCAVALGMFAGVVRTSVHFFDSDYFTPMLVIILIGYIIASAFRFKDRGENLPALGITAGVTGLVASAFKFTDGDQNWFARFGGNYDLCRYTGALFQGHALWHVLSAVMFVCVFEFFRSVPVRSHSVLPWR